MEAEAQGVEVTWTGGGVGVGVGSLVQGVDAAETGSEDAAVTDAEVEDEDSSEWAETAMERLINAILGNIIGRGVLLSRKSF